MNHSTRQFLPLLLRWQTGVLGWPAWLRLLATLPVIALLWLGVWWATLEAAPL